MSLRGGFVVELVRFVLGKRCFFVVEQRAEIVDDVFQTLHVVAVEVFAHVVAVCAQLQNDLRRLVGQVFVLVGEHLAVCISDEAVDLLMQRLKAEAILSESSY